MLNSILPFIVLILVVVFIHEYGHYYFAKNMALALLIFQLDLVKKYLGGTTDRVLDGKFVGFL